MCHNLISVLLPVYNMEDTIEESVESVLNQKNSEFELIVVNDGSSDNTYDILKKYSNRPNVKILTQPNSGKVVAFNRAYQESKGHFFVFFAGDDILPNNSLFIRRELFSQSDDPNAVSCGKTLTFSNEKKFHNILFPKTHAPNFNGGSIMFPKSIAKFIFPIPEILPNEDTWTMLAIQHFASRILISDLVCIKYRIHNNNSMRRGAPFDYFNQGIHHRRKAYRLFLDKFQHTLSTEEKKGLINKIRIEELRYSQKTLKLLFVKDISFIDRMRNIAYSNRIFYNLRVLFFRYLSGWRL